MAAGSQAVVDLGDSRARVGQVLGMPLRESAPSRCPDHRIELRRRGSLWLKLVYGPEDRLNAAGVVRLALRADNRASSNRGVALRWPGLAPGSAARTQYPDAARWRPLFLLTGAKQWLWLEEAHGAPEPTKRLRYLGGMVVDEASGFAGGTDFPYDVAQALTAPGSSGDWTGWAGARPLLQWRKRTPPNVYIETLDGPASSSSSCGALTLVTPEYTDFAK